MRAREEEEDSEEDDEDDEDDEEEEEEDEEEEEEEEEVKDDRKKKFYQRDDYQKEEDQLVPKKRSYGTKNMRFIDEETLKSIDTEFILKQETKRSDCIKDPIFNNQFVRTSEQIKVL